MMNGNFKDPLCFTPGTHDLVMDGPLVATTPADRNVPVRIEVELLDADDNVLETCNSNGNTFLAADAPGSTWSMTKSTNKVARGDTVTAHGTARDAQNNVCADWRSSVTIN